ncbi:MAG: hypothetical protein CL675_14065 [Bdellovibrionaceae bacterium]|nr:hypothetical protein [Pseudobdellovibrionaceae bacterium]
MIVKICQNLVLNGLIFLCTQVTAGELCPNDPLSEEIQNIVRFVQSIEGEHLGRNCRAVLRTDVDCIAGQSWFYMEAFLWDDGLRQHIPFAISNKDMTSDRVYFNGHHLRVSDAIRPGRFRERQIFTLSSASETRTQFKFEQRFEDTTSVLPYKLIRRLKCHANWAGLAGLERAGLAAP